jgi:excisionase family DNA binding protein
MTMFDGAHISRYLPLKQAAAYIGVSRKMLWEHVTTGRIPGHKLGRIWLLDRIEIDAFLHGKQYNIASREGVVAGQKGSL